MLEQESRSFPASYDSTTTIITSIVFAILIFVAFATRSAIIASLGAVLLLVSYAYSPRGYRTTGAGIIVKRWMGSPHIALDTLREVRRGTAEDLQGSYRIFGNGGVFGYYGLFETPRLGRCTWYVTNRNNAVVVVTNVATAVFSPDDVDGFINAIQPLASGTSVAATAPVPVRRNLLPPIAGAAVALPALGFALFAILYSPGLPSYTLTPDSLAIHDRFYPVTLNASSVDIDHIRVVDWAVDAGWRPTTRSNGFSNARYHSGWYRTAAGQKARMYWSRGQRLVLLPPKGDGVPVLLETEAPEEFVNELQRKWSRSASVARPACGSRTSAAV